MLLYYGVLESEGLHLGFKLSEIEIGGKITLHISNDLNHMDMDAIVKRGIDDHLCIIDICFESNRPLNFNNVKIEMEYTTPDGIPYLWRTVQVSYCRSQYVLQTKNDGIRHNRRECFRVGVSVTGRLRMVGNGEKKVMVRDVSLSGFAITDRKKELELKVGDEVRLLFEDIGHILDLAGQVVRIEEHEDMVIYGFQIQNICKDLSSYINTKQRRKS